MANEALQDFTVCECVRACVRVCVCVCVCCESTVRLHGCADLSEPSLLAYARSTTIYIVSVVELINIVSISENFVLLMQQCISLQGLHILQCLICFYSSCYLHSVQKHYQENCDYLYRLRVAGCLELSSIFFFI